MSDKKEETETHVHKRLIFYFKAEKVTWQTGQGTDSSFVLESPVEVDGLSWPTTKLSSVAFPTADDISSRSTGFLSLFTGLEGGGAEM